MYVSSDAICHRFIINKITYFVWRPAHLPYQISHGQWLGSWTLKELQDYGLIEIYDVLKDIE